jgi:hypothetical protein
MSAKLIAENILTKSDFSSATEQEGEYIGQPLPTSSCSGSFRLLSSGDIADFTYNGTATGNGAGDGTTVIDSALSIYGDDYFIGGSVEITSGVCDGESKSVTDFAQSTGTLTTGAFSAQIVSGVTFTLTMAFATRNFDVTLVDGGDTGVGTFKWSHNGGTTFLGRDDPTQANWLGETEVHGNADDATCPIAQTINGAMVVAFRNASDSGYISTTKSTDNGITWQTPVRVAAATQVPHLLLTLASGRMLLYPNAVMMYYSDDNADTWAGPFYYSGYPAGENWLFDGMVELPSGTLLGVFDYSNVIYCSLSEDGGFTWSAKIEIQTAGANTVSAPAVTLAVNGDIVCVYRSDEDAVNDFEVKGNISTDGGVTWGAQIDVIDFTNDYYYSNICTDIDGTIFVVAADQTAKPDIVFTYSTDNGLTWAAVQNLKVTAGTELKHPHIALIHGHQLVCVYYDKDNADIDIVRRGMWEVFAANACPCAILGIKQNLICEVEIVWYGDGGVAGDHWDFEPEYIFSMSNIITDSPSEFWRSEQDNIACSIVIDIGANERFFADGVAFFNCNVRTLSFQMNAADAWGAPSVNENVSFDLITGTVSAVYGNMINDAAVTDNYDDHELAGHYLRMTSGTDNGKTWRIKDNVEDFIVLDTAAATNIAAMDTFVIFQKYVAHTFTNTVPYRFLRVSISAQETAEDYYRIGCMVAGRVISLIYRWGPGYSKTHEYDIEALRTPKGGIIPIVNVGERKRIFKLEWPFSKETREQVIHLLDFLLGKNIALIPDHETLTDAYLVKALVGPEQTGGMGNHFDLSITLEEIL